MKKILFYLTRYPGYGGIESVTSLVIERLTQFNVSVSVMSYLEQYNPNILLDNIKLYHMPDQGKWDSDINCKYAENIFEQEKFDCVIYQDSYAPTEDLICYLTQKYHTKLFVFEHSSPLYVNYKRSLDPIYTFKGFGRFLFHRLLLKKDISRKKKLYGACESYILLSKQYISEFISLLNLQDHSKLLYINNPLVLDLTLENLTKENVIVFVGQFTKNKGIDRILDIWEKIYLEHRDWKLLLIGDGPERISIEEKVRKEKICNVYIEGYKDPTPYYKIAKLFFMVSRFEGWPMTLLESMSYGVVPIAYGSFSSIYDIVDDKENGYIINKNDIRSFISTADEIMKDDGLFNQLSLSCMRKVEGFNVELIINKWRKLLKL